MISKLENPVRIAELSPTGTLKSTGLSEGMVFCDIGAVTGVFSVTAEIITNSIVYAVEVCEQMRDVLRGKSKSISVVDNIRAVPDFICDTALLCTVLHELGDIPDTLAQIRRVLKEHDFIAEKCYQGDDGYKTYKGYRLTAVDGSVFDVNAGAAESFGVLNTAGNPVVKSQVVALADVLNDIIIDAQMGEACESERGLALDTIECIRKKTGPRDLFIFDRGFPSAELIGDLNERRLCFLMRVSRNSLKAVNNTNAPDQTLRITDAKGKPHNLRVVNVILPMGTTEKLVTNTFDLSPDELKEIYNLVGIGYTNVYNFGGIID